MRGTRQLTLDLVSLRVSQSQVVDPKVVWLCLLHHFDYLALVCLSNVEVVAEGKLSYLLALLLTS